MLSRWSSDTSNRSTEEIQQLNTRTSSGTISDSALALTRASPDKSRLKERIRYPLNPRVIVAPIQMDAWTGGMDTCKKMLSPLLLVFSSPPVCLSSMAQMCVTRSFSE